MKSFFFGFLAALIVFAPLAVFGQTTQNDRLATEINALRAAIVRAIERRDRKTLAEIYADDFKHTHATGQVDDKARRIGALASGEKTIESAPPREINVRIYGETTAVVTGRSAITDEAQKTIQYRWMVVYVKAKNAWRVVASQATRIAEQNDEK